MALNLAQKQTIVAEISEEAKASVSLVTADYRGLTTNAMTDLRDRARKSDVNLKIVRNTLARRAFEDTEYACLHDSLVGPTILAFSKESPGAAARLFKDFAKEHKALEVVALSVGGKHYGAEQLSLVASLPTKEEAIGQLLSVMQAPITKLVRTLVAPHEKMVRTVAAVRDAKA